MDCAHNVLVILGGCFREDPVNKYLLSGYNCSRTSLGTVGSTKEANTQSLPTVGIQCYYRGKTYLHEII